MSSMMGGYAGADRCCRQHDLGCPISIEPGATEWGLTNQRIHTVMHCSCDERFRSCLKMARTQTADIVGNIFFNGANPPCFIIKTEKVDVRTFLYDNLHSHLYLNILVTLRRILILFPQFHLFSSKIKHLGKHEIQG